MEKTILFSHVILRYPRFEQTEQFCLAHGFYASDCRGNPCVGTTKKINIPWAKTSPSQTINIHQSLTQDGLLYLNSTNPKQIVIISESDLWDAFHICSMDPNIFWSVELGMWLFCSSPDMHHGIYIYMIIYVETTWGSKTPLIFQHEHLNNWVWKMICRRFGNVCGGRNLGSPVYTLILRDNYVYIYTVIYIYMSLLF